MKQISEYKWHDREKINFTIDLDEYVIDADYWIIYEPEIDLKYIDEVSVNTIYKNGEYLSFVSQKEIPEYLMKEIVDTLEGDI